MNGLDALEVVEVEVDHAMRDLGRHGEPGIALDSREVGGGRLLDRVDVVGQQRGHARRLVLDDPERDLLPRRLLAPIVVVAHQFDAVAIHVAHEFEAAAAHSSLARVEILRRCTGRDLFRHDVDRRQVVGRQRIRRRVLEADRVRVDDLLRDDRLRVRGERPRAVRNQRHAVDRERDVLGGELAAVVELDALAQLVLPRRRVDRLPRRRDPRDHPRVGVHLHELVEDVLGDVVVREEVEEVRVDRRDVGRDGDLEILRGDGRRGGERQCGGERQRPWQEAERTGGHELPFAEGQRNSARKNCRRPSPGNLTRTPRGVNPAPRRTTSVPQHALVVEVGKRAGGVVLRLQRA